MDQARNNNKSYMPKSDSKNPEDLDSPQFQEVVQGFIVEKELLEKRHQEEMEKLKDNFSRGKAVLSESEESVSMVKETENSHHSNTMAGQILQSHMSVNGSSSVYQNGDNHSASQFPGQQPRFIAGMPDSTRSTNSPSYYNPNSGQLSFTEASLTTSGAQAMVNGFSGHSGHVGGEIGMMNGGPSHGNNAQLWRHIGQNHSPNGINASHGNTSLNGTLYQPHGTTNGYHSEPSGHMHSTLSSNSPSGIYHGPSMKNSHPSSWNPTFYTHNLGPPGENAAVNNPRGGYDVGLRLMNNSPSMRVNTDHLASQIRPDLDYEDRLEQQREFMQQQFAEEKRQVRQVVQEEFTKKFEVEKQKHVEVINSFKKTTLELEYQKKEVEVKIKHERESLELKFESQRTEYERKCRKQLEEYRGKRESKYEAEMLQLKETYEGMIEKLKTDIQSLTLQLEEQNENLKLEKDNVVAAFEKEIKEFKERVRLEREKIDSEVEVKLNSEISLLTSVNKSLREEINVKEREKQELESFMKEERSRTELHYESQITEIESHFESEKQLLLAQYEEKVALLLKKEKSQISIEELNAIKKKNETLEEIVENNYKMEHEASLERDSIMESLIEEKSLLQAQLEEFFAKQQSGDICSREDYEKLMFASQHELRESREFSERIQRDLKLVQEEKNVLVVKVEGLFSEINNLKKENISGSAINDEKNKLLHEVSRLNEEVDKLSGDLQEKGRKDVLLKENLNKLEDRLHNQETENTQLKLERMETQNKIAILERQTNDLKNDLSSMRRRKVELEEENCNLKREKSSVDGRLHVLETTNNDLVQDTQKTKQKTSQLEEELSALKLEKLELQQQIRLRKMQDTNYHEATHRLNTVSDSDTSGSLLTSTDETAGKDNKKRSKRKTGLEREISKLKREKVECEVRVERLRQDVETLEREALKQIEHNKAVSAEFISAKKDIEKQMEVLKSEKEALKASITKVQHEEEGVKNSMKILEQQKRELGHGVDFLREEEQRLRNASEEENERMSENLEKKIQDLQRRISELESNKRELHEEVEKLEHNEATLRCSIEELQHESQLLSQRISQMKESVLDVGRKRVSLVEDKVADERSLGLNNIMDEITKLRRERDDLIRNVSELERKQTNLDVSVESAEKNRLVCERDINALSRKRTELESVIFTLRNEKFELEARSNELSTTSVENATNAQRKEIEILRNELEITRESCEDIRSMYHSVRNEGNSKVEIVETELRLAEDNLMRLKRERLELEKTISTLLRQKTELESEVALIMDSKYREDRDTNALREERLNLDTELVRLRSQISELRLMLSNLEDAKAITEQELRNLDARKERVDSYVSGVEARLLIGQKSPVSWNISPPKEYILTPRDDLEKQVLELREQKLSLETDLFKLRRKSGDGIDTRSCGYHESTRGQPSVNLGYNGTTDDYVGQIRYDQNQGLQQDIQGLAEKKLQLSSEVQEMRVKKTDLDTQITNLEYRKLGLEQSGRLVTRRETEGLSEQSECLVKRWESEGFVDKSERLETKQRNDNSEAEHSGSLVTRLENESSEFRISENLTEEYSVKMDFVNYSVEQMQELRLKNTSLEEKLSALENRLHDAKYEMEQQTLDYLKELKLVQNALASQQQSESGQQQHLGVIVERLNKFIEESQFAETDQLYEDIRLEIRDLNSKVESNSQKMRAMQEKGFKKEENSSEVRNGTCSVDEICEHIQDAEWNMERYNEVVSHLQQENTDLTEVVARLEKRLTMAGKSHEILQRKKVILQQLLETVSVKTGEDLIQQSTLIFELDKDTAI